MAALFRSVASACPHSVCEQGESATRQGPVSATTRTSLLRRFHVRGGGRPREAITTMVSQLAEGCASCERTHPEPPLWFFQLGSSCSNRPADQMDGECTEDQPVDGDRAPPEGVESARNDARDGDRSAYRVGDGDRYGGRALCARVGSTQEPTDDAEPDQRCAEEAR